jgi:hypothetical protein
MPGKGNTLAIQVMCKWKELKDRSLDIRFETTLSTTELAVNSSAGLK